MSTESSPGAEMSFLEHLDELRTRLVRSAIAIAAMFIIGWFVSGYIFAFLSIPVTEALERARAAREVSLGTQASTDLASVAPGTELQYSFAAAVQMGGVEIPTGTTIAARMQLEPDGKRTLVLARAWGLGGKVFPEGTPIPVDVVAAVESNNPGSKLVIETVQGTFNLYVKVAFYAAIVFSVPYLLFQIWGFISPGLYPHERSYVTPFVVLCSLCFALGVVFAYKIAFPAACDYLIGLGDGNFQPLINAHEYFDLVLFIMLGLGLVFQIPTITYFLARLGLVTARTLVRVWRYAIIGIFIVAAVVSPTADIPNLLVFATPMLGLYVVSIGIAWFFHRKRKTQDEVDAMEEAAQG
ncbi:MAG TPA: twin-arginine translocase subunit TatC [Blastocatellia bacterium]|nr:twin-arginine translocase subunit TatC [Blastocatellia bacterium]